MEKNFTILKPLSRFAAIISFVMICSNAFSQQSTTGFSRSIHDPKFEERSLLEQYASWGVDPNDTKSSINVQEALKLFAKKKDIVVAVIDTGIDPTHPFIKDNLYVPGKSTTEQNYGIDFSKDYNNRYTPFDQHGHGTHVSGIVKSVFPDVKILALKYYNPKATGQDNLNSTIEALRYAVDMGVDIINYSGGGPEPALEELRILKQAERKGILIIAAAGNERSNIDIKSNAYYPASYGLNNIISVTAYDQEIQLLPSSNYGSKSVDIAAPGQNIRSALPYSRAGYLTGTSQATAFVTGVAALIKSQFPELNSLEIKAIIKQSASQVPSLIGKCATNGKLNAGDALKLAAKYSKEIPTAGRRLATEQSKDQGTIIYRKRAK